MNRFYGIVFMCACLLLSCVSQKKYNEQVALVAQHETRIYHLKQDSIAKQRRIDSLVKDSAELQAKIEELKKTRNGSSAPQMVYYKSTISEEKEYQLKTVYIYNIAVNTEWEGKYKSGDFVVGVLGKSKIADELKKGLANKKKSSQSFVIKEFASIAEIGECHMLFISNGFYFQLTAIKSKTSKYPALLVSEEDFSGTLSHFNLAVDGEEIKMFVNREAIKKAPFKVSKTLLNMAAN
ncbi:MAG: YfiR family protein [Bacteroidota bacterium]